MASIKTLYANLLSLATSVTPFGLAAVIAPIAECAFIHGQIKVTELNQLRAMTSKNVKPIQVAVGKAMPIKWNKEAKSYEFDKAKRSEVIEALGLTLAEGNTKLTAEQNAANLELLRVWILDLLTPKEEEDEDDKVAVVKAWTEAQSKAQAERLQSMDLDQLELQIKALKALLSQADSVRSSKLSSVKLAV
jgi:hypothetical protein